MIYRKITSRLSFCRKDVFFLFFILVLGLLALWSYFNLDQQVFSLWRREPINWHSNYWIKAFRYLGRAWLPIWLLLVWFLSTGRQRPVLITFLALIIVAVMVNPLKVGVRRPRPREVLKTQSWQEEQPFLSYHLSFPSGDAAVAFAVATVITSFVTWPLACLLLAASTGIALLRVTAMAHYPSDVLAGAGIGLLAGWLAIQTERRYLPLQRPRFNLTRGMAIWGIIIIPVAFRLPEGIDEFVIFLKTYGLLAVGIALSTKINLEKIYAIINSAYSKLLALLARIFLLGKRTHCLFPKHPHEGKFTTSKSLKMAFGVEESNRTYRPRLARYQALAEEVAAFVKEQKLRNDEKLNLLDVGSGSGRSMRFIDATGVSKHIAFFGIDNSEKRLASVYMPHRWVLKHFDLETGSIPFDTGMFDIVICEQVLEHLTNPGPILEEMARVLRPGGLLIVGTTIYWPGLALARRYVVPVFNGLVSKSRSHKQVFTSRSFVKLVNNARCFSIRQIRGFRIISGGVFGWLEDFSWWYKLNRFLGRVIPWLCPDVQVVAIRAPFASGQIAHIEYTYSTPVAEKKVRLKVAISALKKLPIGTWLATLAKACQSIKLRFAHMSKAKVSYADAAPNNCHSVTDSNNRFERIVNWLRRKRAVALRIAFPIIIAENIIDGEKPHELLPLHEGISAMAVIALILVLAGALIRFWARGHFRKGWLLTTGPYAIVRHPLYLGSLLVVVGVLFQLNDWVNWVVVLPVFTIFYGAAIIYEERALSKRFGREWEIYRAKVPAVIPSLRNWPLPRPSVKWSWKFYLATTEVKATLWLLTLPLWIEIIEDVVFERMLGI